MIRHWILLCAGLATCVAAQAHTPATPYATWRGTSLNDVPRLAFLGEERAGRIVRIDLQVAGIGEPEATQACGASVLFVYGAYGQVGDFRLISERLRRVPIEQYYFDFDERSRRTSVNGKDLAEGILRLRQSQHDRSCRLVVIAHSMGGLAARVALNHLAAHTRAEVGQVELITIDSPWPGYNGPSDQGIDSIMSLLASPFVPEGFMELRSRSTFFATLNHGSLPSHLSFRMYFAAEGDQVEDYSEFPNTRLVHYIIARYREREDADQFATPAIRNLWLAMVSSAQFPALEREISGLLRRHQLNEDQVNLALERTFLHFEGNHTTVMVGHEQFAEYVSYDVAGSIEDDLARATGAAR